MNQVELVECIVRVVNVCHPHLHPVLYERKQAQTIIDGLVCRYLHFS